MLQNLRLIISLHPKKEKGKIACQRSMTHNEEERIRWRIKEVRPKNMSEKDGVPKNYDKKVERINQEKKGYYPPCAPV